MKHALIFSFGQGDNDSLVKMSLSSVPTSSLIAEVLSRIDSVAHGVTMTGQEVPMSIDTLAEGWGSIIDMHIFAANNKP